MHGFELRRLDSGALLVTRWGLARELPDLEAVARFAERVGVLP
jgi:hypothetical protein